MNRRSWSGACVALVTVVSLMPVRLALGQEEPTFRPNPGVPDRGPADAGGGAPPRGGPGGPSGSGDDGAGHFFDALDANKDGAVTEDEVVRFARDRFREAVSNADLDHDHRLTRLEFEHAAQVAHQRPAGNDGSFGDRPRPPTSAELFRAFDTNHDGKLTAAETPEPHRPSVLGLLARLGKGPDGYLTPKDFERLGEDHGERRPQGGGDQRGPGGGNAGPGSGSDGDDQRPNPELVFRIVDRNRDGRVDRTEAEMAPPGPRAGMLALFNRLGVTSITKAEFMSQVAPMTQAPASGPEGGPAKGDAALDVDAMFDQFDHNRDGRLTLAELEGSRHQGLKDALRALGKSETGISKAELRELVARNSGQPPSSGSAPGAPNGRPPSSGPR